LANHISALKRAKQNETRRLRNKAYRTQVRKAIKTVRQAIENNDKILAADALRTAASTIDKAAAKGVLHNRTATRYISRLSAQTAQLSA
jgi:small subunit ribosomal protein S20